MIKISQMKLASRLIIIFILLGLIPFLLMGNYAYLKSKRTIQKAVEQHIISLRENKKEQLEESLSTIQAQLLTYAESPRFTEAMQAFAKAYQQIPSDLGDWFGQEQAAYEERLKAYYVYQRNQMLETQEDAINRWWPNNKTTMILQHLYISSNPYPAGNKDQLNFAPDTSSYTQTHARYHPMLHNIAERFNFYDIFLIEPNQGNIVYTVAKEIDYATSLLNGPFRNSQLAKLVERVMQTGKPDGIYFSDFHAYEPSANHPAAFIAVPLYQDKTLLGILAVQMPLDKINRIMTHHKDWIGDGFGKTGETLLLGEDGSLHSEARLFLEDKPKLLKELASQGAKPEILSKIERYNSTIDALPFHSAVFEKAIQEQKTGMESLLDYVSRPSLVAYTPIQFLDAHWLLVAKIDKDEAYELVDDLQYAIWFFGGSTAIIVIVTGWFFGRSLTRPLLNTINNLSSASSQIAATINEQERITAQQSTSVAETNTTMEELGASAQQSAEQASTSAHNMKTVLNSSQEGVARMEEMLRAMENLKEKVNAIARQILHLSEQTNQIGNISDMVTLFANETKMLAMNAAVEAVRAGEHGKGFSVISVEIRKLADESKRSAERIRALVEEVQQATNATVMVTEEGTKTVETSRILAQNTMETFNQVANLIGYAHESTQQISLNVRQQADAVRQVLEAMKALNTSAKETAVGISQTKGGIQNLNGAAQDLKRMV